MEPRFPILMVSACLAGVACRYNGDAYPVAAVEDLVRAGDALPICPERLGGLPSPRQPVEWRDGKAVDEQGGDWTAAFVSGAQQAARVAKTLGCTGAILKARSPSCGCGCIYDGSFSHTRIAGDGLFSRLLKEQGVQVITEEEELAAFLCSHCGGKHG